MIISQKIIDPVIINILKLKDENTYVRNEAEKALENLITATFTKKFLNNGIFKKILNIFFLKKGE